MNVRLFRLFALTLAILLFATATVSAQSAPWRVIQAGDGTLYLLKDGVRSPLVPSPMGDDELATIPAGDPIYGELTVPTPQVITVVATPTAALVAAPTVPAPVAPVAGARDNPIPLGAPGQFADGWNVVVVSKAFDGTSAVLKENQFNDPPQPGDQFVIGRIQATYTGLGSKRFSTSRLVAVGASSVSYTTFRNSCGVYPDALKENEVFTGGAIVGNVCWAVRSADVGSLQVFDSSAKPESRAFLSLH